MSDLPTFARAAAALRHAFDNNGALIIAAGAGMGVDSGLPDFRGPEGFWRAYPAYRHLNLRFEQLANPHWFAQDPALAWGFYGHRLNLYRHTTPHAGFAILHDWLKRMPNGGFVFTSNVDGHFQKAGFPDDRIEEVHGNIHFLQCQHPHCCPIWSADNITITIDDTTGRAVGDLPRCPTCDAIARPNILMFGDDDWDDTRTDTQHAALQKFLRPLRNTPIVIIELGAGTAIPTVRYFSEAILQQHEATLLRINPREPQGPQHTISLPAPARESLQKLSLLLQI